MLSSQHSGRRTRDSWGSALDTRDQGQPGSVGPRCPHPNMESSRASPQKPTPDPSSASFACVKGTQGCQVYPAPGGLSPTLR